METKPVVNNRIEVLCMKRKINDIIGEITENTEQSRRQRTKGRMYKKLLDRQLAAEEKAAGIKSIKSRFSTDQSAPRK